MFEKVVMLAGLQGLDFPSLLSQWQAAGLFTYILPFLIIFALVFGLLSKMDLFGDDSRAVNAIIALAVGLLALQFGFVSDFFSELFPRFGVAIGVLLAAIILFGMFIGKKSNWLWMVIAGIAFGFVILKSFTPLGWAAEFDLLGNAGLILLVLVIVIVVTIASKKNDDPDDTSLMSKTLKYGK